MTAKVILRRAARDAFAEFCIEHDMIQAAELGRLVEWFLDLDRVTQDAILGRLKGRDRLDVAKLALQRIIAQEQASLGGCNHSKISTPTAIMSSLVETQQSC